MNDASCQMNNVPVLTRDKSGKSFSQKRSKLNFQSTLCVRQSRQNCYSLQKN